AVGMTAKELVDQRVALEARRRLTDDGVTAAAVAHELGFSEATNFVKFFRRLVGLSPTEWQAGLRSSSA
ncbi:MAG: helix-turn-helix domain-containing protein, partial [Actinomycetota bacterium]